MATWPHGYMATYVLYIHTYPNPLREDITATALFWTRKRNILYTYDTYAYTHLLAFIEDIWKDGSDVIIELFLFSLR